jgi:hypothetical protein
MPPETLSSHASVLQAVEYVRHAGEWVSFWSAVSLPFVTIPLLVTGLDTPGETAAFVCLLLANFVALVAGRGYNAD